MRIIFENKRVIRGLGKGRRIFRLTEIRKPKIKNFHCPPENHIIFRN